MPREDYADYGADPEALFLDPDTYDDAIVGVCYDGRIVYDINRIIAILMTRDGMTEEDAMDYFAFNIGGAYVGDMTPVYVTVVP